MQEFQSVKMDKQGSSDSLMEDNGACNESYREVTSFR